MTASSHIIPHHLQATCIEAVLLRRKWPPGAGVRNTTLASEVGLASAKVVSSSRGVHEEWHTQDKDRF